MLRTKAGVSAEELGDQYFMLGPYNEETVKLEVEILEPEMFPVREALRVLNEQGNKVWFFK